MQNVELKEFIESTLKQVGSSVDSQKGIIDSGIEIEVSISEVAKADGGIKIYVLSANAGKEVSHTAKIKFTVIPSMSEDQIEQLAVYSSIKKG